MKFHAEMFRREATGLKSAKNDLGSTLGKLYFGKIFYAATSLSQGEWDKACWRTRVNFWFSFKWEFVRHYWEGK